MPKYKFLTDLNDEEEEEQLVPSQIAREEQKQKYQYLTELNEPFVPPEKPKPPAPPPEPEPKARPTFFEKARGIVGRIAKGVKEFLVGEKRPVAEEVRMPEDQYVNIVGSIYERKIDTERQLEEKRKELQNLQLKLPKFRQIGANEEEARLVREVFALEETIKDYENFISREPARRGFLQQVLASIKDPSELLNLNRLKEAEISAKETKVMKKYEAGQELTDEEMIYFNRFRARTLDSYIKRGVGSMVADVVTDMPYYIMEIAVMSHMAGEPGAYTKLATGFSNSVKLTSPVARELVNKVLANSVRKAVASRLDIPSIEEKTAEYMLPTYEIQMGTDEKDFLKLVKPGFDRKAAVSKAYASNLVEYVSEGVGDYVDDALPFVKKLFISKWLDNKNITSPATATEILRKMNFNSIVGEVLEEEVAEPIQSIIDEREYKDPFFTPEGRERLLVETLGIGAFSGLAKVSDITQNALTKRRQTIPNDTMSLKAEVEAPEEPIKPPEAKKPKIPPAITEEIEKRVKIEKPPKVEEPIIEKPVVKKPIKPMKPTEIKKIKIEPTTLTTTKAVDIIETDTPRTFSNYWDEAQAQVRKVTEPLENRLAQAKESLSAIKGRKKEAMEGRKKLRKEIESLETKISEIEGQVEEEAMNFNIKLALQAMKEAEKMGLDLGRIGDGMETVSEKWGEFRDDFLMQISERPYIEQNWETPIKEIIADMVRERGVKVKEVEIKKPPVKRVTTKELEPLAEEARKYESTEELPKVGKEIVDRDGRPWIITEILSETRFKAAPKSGVVVQAEKKIMEGKLMMKNIEGEWTDVFGYTFDTGKRLPAKKLPVKKPPVGKGALPKGFVAAKEFVSGDTVAAKLKDGTIITGTFHSTDKPPFLWVEKADGEKVVFRESAAGVPDIVMIGKKEKVKVVPKKPAPRKPVKRPPRKVRRLPKTDTAKLYTQINKKVRTLPVIQENVRVKDGKLQFTNLNIFVTTPTKLEDGMYRVIGKDFIKSVAPVEDYPLTPKPGKRVGSISSEDIGDIYSKFKYFVSKDEARPILTGLYFEAKEGKLAVTATDGFRLLHQEYPIKIDKDFSFVVSETKTLASILSILQKGKIEIFEKKSGKQTGGLVTFSDGVSEVTVRKVEGEFPEYTRIAPSFESEMVFDKKALLQAIKDLAPYAKERANIVRFDVKEKEIIGRAETYEGVKKKVTIPIKRQKSINLKKEGTYQGSILMPIRQEEMGKQSLALNYRLLSDSLRVLDGDEVVLRLHKEKGSISLFPIHISDVEEEPIYLPKKKIKKTVQAPSGYADKGEYAKLENLSIETNKINIVEFPELVTIAREISGKIPEVAKLRGMAKGRFYGGIGTIRLDPSIFEDPILAAKTMAHELGHLADYLPKGTLKRGNLIGRIATLNYHLKHEYGDLKDPVLREELKRLTQMWKPFDEYASENYTKYRYSSKELYADAISVLFNDPKRLKQEAPHFWKGFFDYIDRKPKVKENFFAIWDLLTEGEEAVLSKRQKSIRDSFKRGEDQFILIQEERLRRRRDFVFRLKHELIDKNQAVIDLVEKAKKEGKVINDDDNPVYWLEEQNYVGGVVKNWVETKIQPIYKDIMGSELTWEDFGEVLFHERVMNERGELANPLGFNPKTSAEQLEYLERKLGKDKWAVIQRNLPKFRQAIKEVEKKAAEAGLRSPDLEKEIEANPAYATFQVIDYMDLYIPASVKRQIGTLKEITNPATATVMKSISIIRAAERNTAKRKLTDFLKEFAAEEITDAKTRWTGKFHEPIDSREPDQKLFTLMEEGKVKGYYVDPYIASTFDYLSTGTNNAVVGLLRFFNGKLFRPMFITFNLGFQSFNLMRDFLRFYKNTPRLSLIRALRRYVQATPAAIARGWDLPNKTIQEMEKSKLLGMTYNDIITGRTTSDKQIERVIERVGLSALKGRKVNFFLKPFVTILDVIERLGNAIETLPKVAGYKELNGKMPSKELGSFIRTSVGSPDFLRRGAGYGWYNEVFLFSNAIKEGIRADYNVAFKNPKTRAGYWWKTTLLNFLPKIIMFAGLSGLFGAMIKKMLEDVSEYDKTNYIIIPLGRKKNRTIYFRGPQDETGRLLGGILWKILRIANNNKPIMRDISDLLSYTGGQLPSVTPMIEALTSTAQFLAGKNPYDFFRGRSVIPDDAFEAGGKYSLKPFLTWQLNQLGGGVFWKGYISMQAPEDKTWIQKTVEAPILSNIIGRWIKVSNYGQREKNRAIIEKTGQKEARRRLEERNKINEAISQYQSKGGNKEAIKNKLVKDILGDPPYDATQKAKRTNIKKKFDIGVLRGREDPNINSLIEANTNAEKLELMKELYRTLDSGEFNEIMDIAKDHKIISKPLYREFEKEKNKLSKLGTEGSILADLIKKIRIVKPAYAAESEYYRADPFVADSLEDISFVKSVKKWLKEIFHITPGQAYAPKEQIISDKPYTLQMLESGLVRLDYQNGAYSDIKESDLPEYLASWQKLYPEITGKKWPSLDYQKMLGNKKTKTAKKPIIETAKAFVGLAQKEPGEKHAKTIVKSAKKNKVNSALVAAILWQESEYNPKAKNDGGEDGVDRGIAQINSKWHPEVTDEQAYDPEWSIKWLTKELASLIKYFDGDINKAIAAYNVGRSGVKDNLGQDTPFGGGPKGQEYIDNVARNLTKELRKELGLKTTYD